MRHLRNRLPTDPAWLAMSPELIMVEYHAIQKSLQVANRLPAQPGEETTEFDGSDAFAALASLMPDDDDDYTPVDPGSITMPQ